MKIVVCYKIVPDDQDIKVNPDCTISLEQAERVVGQYDFNAVEAAMQIKESMEDCHVYVLTVGGEEVSNAKLKKSILSRGPEAMYGVKDELLADMDCFGTARVLARAIEKIGDVDLVICGEGSGDSYQQQTGNVLGRILGWATLNGINHLEASEDRAFVERSTETDIEEYEVFYPAVLSVTSDINLPRIASFKEIMGAGKKPATIWSLKDVEADVERSVVYDAVEAPQQTERKRLIVEGDDDEAIGQFYNYIKTCI